MYPDLYFYDMRDHLFYNWEAVINLEELLHLTGYKVLLVGGPIQEELRNEMIRNGFPVRDIYRGRTQALYELDTLKIQSRLESKKTSRIFEIMCNTDTLSPDGKYFLSSGFAFGRGDLQSDEKSRSGEYSVKLDNEHQFALDYTLTEILPGQQYKVSVYRFSDNNEGHLVVAAEDPDLFYKAVNDYSIIDSQGWKQLNMYFMVPEDFGDKKLKIYVWNNGKTTVFFDDLLIVRKK
jgi:hypothetical protein